MEYIILALKGAAIGIANAIPGVSGGTIAVITKIYDRLLDAIDLNFKKIWSNLPFLIPVGIGIVIGVIAAAFTLDFLFENFNVPTQLFFVGVIIGSAPLIYKEATLEKKLKLSSIIPFLIGFCLIISLSFINPVESGVETDFVLTFFSGAELFFGGIIAAVAMIIPGISGSLMLKIYGSYETVIYAVTEFDFPILIIFGMGALIGLLVSAKLISIQLKKHRIFSYLFIGGLIIGSIPAVFPAEFQFNLQGIIGILVLAVGIILPNLTELPSKKK